jgi:hypothetical protein
MNYQNTSKISAMNQYVNKYSLTMEHTTSLLSQITNLKLTDRVVVHHDIELDLLESDSIDTKNYITKATIQRMITFVNNLEENVHIYPYTTTITDSKVITNIKYIRDATVEEYFNEIDKLILNNIEITTPINHLDNTLYFNINNLRFKLTDSQLSTVLIAEHINSIKEIKNCAILLLKHYVDSNICKIETID